jgi:hypothetical protein
LLPLRWLRLLYWAKKAARTRSARRRRHAQAQHRTHRRAAHSSAAEQLALVPQARLQTARTIEI